MICPRCGKETQERICSCGHDFTMDYLNFATLTEVPHDSQQDAGRIAGEKSPRHPAHRLFLLGLAAMLYWAWYPWECRDLLASDPAPVRYFVPVLALLVGEVYLFLVGIKPAKGVYSKVCMGLGGLFGILTAGGYMAAAVMVFTDGFAMAFQSAMFGLLFQSQI